jgi:hypothetical protein
MLGMGVLCPMAVPQRAPAARPSYKPSGTPARGFIAEVRGYPGGAWAVLTLAVWLPGSPSKQQATNRNPFRRPTQPDPGCPFLGPGTALVLLPRARVQACRTCKGSFFERPPDSTRTQCLAPTMQHALCTCQRIPPTHTFPPRAQMLCTSDPREHHWAATRQLVAVVHQTRKHQTRQFRPSSCSSRAQGQTVGPPCHVSTRIRKASESLSFSRSPTSVRPSGSVTRTCRHA